MATESPMTAMAKLALMKDSPRILDVVLAEVDELRRWREAVNRRIELLQDLIEQNAKAIQAIGFRTDVFGQWGDTAVKRLNELEKKVNDNRRHEISKEAS